MIDRITVNPPEVPCPHCGAEAGESCHRQNSTRIEPTHRDRCRAARGELEVTVPTTGPYTVPCPICASPVGKRCTRPSDSKTTATHIARLTLAANPTAPQPPPRPTKPRETYLGPGRRSGGKGGLMYRVTRSARSPSGGWFLLVCVSLGGGGSETFGLEVGAEKCDADGEWSERALRTMIEARMGQGIK
jgi:hypothetical protein